jgi:hypothetical protein
MNDIQNSDIRPDKLLYRADRRFSEKKIGEGGGILLTIGPCSRTFLIRDVNYFFDAIS